MSAKRVSVVEPAYKRFYLAIGLGALLLVLGAIVQTWLASRLNIWGDEFDTINAVYRNFKGPNNFWDLIGRYPAAPPADYLLLRYFYRSGALSWLLERTPEVYWRLPYITIYLFSCVLATLGAWRWTRSVALSFVALALGLSLQGPFAYGNEVRFYSWLLLFVTAAIWQFMVVFETRKLRDLAVLSGILSVGLWFHLLLAPIAYLAMALGLVWALSAANKVRKTKADPKHLAVKGAQEALPPLLIAAIPFVVLKVLLKHFIYLFPPARSFGETLRFMLQRGFSSFSDLVLWSFAPLPPQLAGVLLFLTILVLGGLVLWFFFIKDWKRVGQGVVLAILLVGAPAALCFNAVQTGYVVVLMPRHFIFVVPVFGCVLAYFYKAAGDIGVAMTRIRVAGPSVSVAVLLLGFVFASTSIFSMMRAMADGGAGTKVIYRMNDWRDFYDRLPGRHQLVVVGNAPDLATQTSDSGAYTAGTVGDYVAKFSPVFYSAKDGRLQAYGRDKKPQVALADQIERNPGQYDYLVVERLDWAKSTFKKLRWPALDCYTYPLGLISFCRAKSN